MMIKVGRIEQPAGHRYRRVGDFPLWTVELVAAGAMDIKGARSRKWRTVEAGTLVLVHPDTAYWEVVPDGSLEYFAVFRPQAEMLPLLRWPALEPGLMVRPLDERAGAARDAAEELVRHARSRSEAGRALAANALDRLLLLGALSGSTAAAAEPSPPIAEAVAILEQQLTGKVAVPELARAVKMSVSSLAHRFRAEMGESPAAYHERLRLRKARELLLTTNRRVKEIATLTGFRDPYSFSARCRRRTGQSPRDYRRSPQPWGGMNQEQ